MTPNHIQEQLSLAYVKAVVYRAGFNFSKISVDDHKIDGTIQSYSNGVNRVDFQLKATTDFTVRDGSIAYDLEVRTYNLLVEQEGIPAVLILYVMPKDSDQWLEQSEEQMHLRNAAYWHSLEGNPDPQTGRRSVSMLVAPTFSA